MLTKDDILQIKEVIDESIDSKVQAIVDGSIETKIKPLIRESITNAFADFHKNIFDPAIENIEQDHKTMMRKIDKLTSEMDEVKEYIKDHAKRIENLEQARIVKN